MTVVAILAMTRPTCGQEGVPALATPDSARGVVEAEADDAREDRLYEEYLEWVDRRAASPSAVRSLAFSGVIEGDLCRGELKVAVETSVPDEVVSFAMPRAVLTGAETLAGGGRFDRLEEGVGHFWRFPDAGRHAISVTVLVPVERRGVARRLALSLPGEVAIASAQIDFGGPVADLTAGGRSVLDTSGATERPSRASLYGVSPRLDLSWEVTPEAADESTKLRVTTAVVAAIDPTGTRIRATQRVQSTRGRFSEFHTTLPAGFEIVEVSGRDYLSHRIDTEAGGGEPLATVELAEPTVGPVEINWVLVRTGDPGSRFAVRGFRVEEIPAGEQRGTLTVTATDEFAVDFPRDGQRAVRRADPAVPTADPVAGAYRLLRQPFRVTVRPRRLEPLATVEVDEAVTVDRGEVAVDLRIRLEPLRGAVSEFAIRWPGARDWSFLPSRDGPLGLTAIERPSDDAAETVRVRLPSTVRDATEVRLRVTRPVVEGRLSIPVATVPGFIELPASFTVRHRGTADVRVEDLKTVAVDDAEAGVDPAWRSRRVLLGAGDEAVAMTVRPRESSVRVREVVSAVITGGVTEATQSFEAVVTDGTPLDGMRFVVPEGVARFAVTLDGEPARFTRSRDAGGQRVVAVDPLEGVFGPAASVEISWRADTAGSDDDVATLGLFRPLGVERNGTALRLSSHRGGVPVGAAWIRDASAAADRWVSPEAVDVVAFRDAPVPDRSFAVDVDSAVVRVSVDAGGRVAGRCEIAFWTGSDRLTVTAVPSTRITGYAFAGEARTAVGRTRPNVDGVVIAVPAGEAGRKRSLTLWFESRVADVGFGGRVAFHAPTIAEAARVARTAWEVVAPDHLLLADYDRAFSPEYVWRLGRLGFGRVATAGAADLLGVDSGERGEISPYVFSAFGSAPDLSVRFLTRTTVFAVGAGLSAVLAFVCLAVARRDAAAAVTLLVAAFGCGASVYPAATPLFAQPAALGMLVVFAAAWVDRREKSQAAGIAADDFELDELVGGLAADHEVADAISVDPGSHERGSPSAETVRPGRVPAGSGEAVS